MNLRKYNLVIVLIIISISIAGGMSCSHKVKSSDQQQKVASFVFKSNDASVVSLREKDDFAVLMTQQFNHGGYYCVVRSAGDYGVIVFANDGRPLHVEPRVIFSPAGKLSPVLAQLKNEPGEEQLVLSIPFSQLTDPYVKLKILDCSPSSVTTHVVSQYVPGYAKGKKAFGVFPVLVTISFNQQFLWIVQKSAKSPFEVLEHIRWDNSEKKYKVTLYSKLDTMS